MTKKQHIQLDEINQKLMKKIAEYSLIVVEEVSKDYDDWCELSVAMILPSSFQKLSLMFQTTSIEILKEMMKNEIKH
jgi:hypothetical protein